MGKDQHAAAIKVLELNRKQFPQSANCYDSLADAYIAAGDKQRAVATYRQLMDLISDLDSLEAPVRKYYESTAGYYIKMYGETTGF